MEREPRPTRLTRAESRAQTREDILNTAKLLFAQEGFRGASLEAIALQAGYSKGAVYSNFESKEDLFVAVVETYQHESLASALPLFEGAPSNAELVDRLANWADKLAQNGIWGFLVLEYARHVGHGSPLNERQSSLIRQNWHVVGEKLRVMFRDDMPVTSQALGALVFELTHAPLSGLVTTLTVGGLVRVTFEGLILAYGRPESKNNQARGA